MTTLELHGIYHELSFWKEFVKTDRFLKGWVKKVQTPIELPSDEEIEKVAEKTLSVNLIGFITGAKWMKEQILNQNK